MRLISRLFFGTSENLVEDNALQSIGSNGCRGYLGREFLWMLIEGLAHYLMGSRVGNSCTVNTDYSA